MAVTKEYEIMQVYDQWNQVMLRLSHVKAILSLIESSLEADYYMG